MLCMHSYILMLISDIMKFQIYVAFIVKKSSYLTTHAKENYWKSNIREIKNGTDHSSCIMSSANQMRVHFMYLQSCIISV